MLVSILNNRTVINKTVDEFDKISHVHVMYAILSNASISW